MPHHLVQLTTTNEELGFLSQFTAPFLKACALSHARTLPSSISLSRARALPLLRALAR